MKKKVKIAWHQFQWFTRFQMKLNQDMYQGSQIPSRRCHLWDIPVLWSFLYYASPHLDLFILLRFCWIGTIYIGQDFKRCQESFDSKFFLCRCTRVFFLAHLSQRLKLAFLIKICLLSVIVSFQIFFFFSRTTGPISIYLPQSITGWWEVKFVQMKDHVLFIGEII